MGDKQKTANMLGWQDELTPRSMLYDDIYFSSQDGLLESEAVFLNGIDAPRVWNRNKNYTICELGFGTGLNFLLTVRQWMRSRGSDQTLHYIATELYPLRKTDIDRAIHWSELSDVKEEFLEQYPMEQFELEDGAVKFTLLVGDCATMLSGLANKIDAWYMDGFSPRKNPDMWSKEIFSQMARLSVPGAKIATFTSAGFVRRGLVEAGFDIRKRPGFGKKREMLQGKYQGF